MSGISGSDFYMLTDTSSVSTIFYSGTFRAMMP